MWAVFTLAFLVPYFCHFKCMAFCRCKEQSLKRQNNSRYSDPDFSEADSLRKDAQTVQPCGLFGFFIILPPKNVKMYWVPLYRVNVWTCVPVSIHTQSWCEIVWNPAAEASWTMIFTLGPYHSPWTGGKECVFIEAKCYSAVGQEMACNTSGKFRILYSCVLIHTHTVHSSMHIEERSQNTSLLLSCVCTVHLYSFQEIMPTMLRTR